MEKIEIKDFIGIKDVAIEVKQINILIGPQASGKSIIVKLLFYFKNFISDIISAAQELESKRELDKNFKRKFKEYFPPSSWGNKNFKIRYSINQEFIEVSKKQRTEKGSPEVVLNYSNFYKDEFVQLKKIIQNKAERIADQDIQVSSIISRYDVLYGIRRSFLRSIATKLSRTAAFSQLFIPAGRSFFANLKSSIFTFLSENNAVDPFLIEFGTYYENVKSPIRLERIQRSTKNKRIYDEINSLTRKILCGRHIQEDGEDYLEVDDGRKISIVNSSSGQQETLPLAIILRTISSSKPEIGGTSIYIEEPEAHIFPAAQRDMVELISTVYNSRKNSLQFLITTHSPYVLTAFNNLLQAGLLSVNATEEKMEKISHYVPVSRLLHPDELAVYSLSNGSCQSIIDIETGLINTNIIDEVSNELAVQFDNLLDIDEKFSRL